MTNETWEQLARRFIRHEGGTVHFTEPAADLLAEYHAEINASIYAHFRTAGQETDARTYLTVYDEQTGQQSPTDKRIGMQYVPSRDALVIWAYGEADHDPDKSELPDE